MDVIGITTLLFLVFATVSSQNVTRPTSTSSDRDFFRNPKCDWQACSKYASSCRTAACCNCMCNTGATYMSLNKSCIAERQIATGCNFMAQTSAIPPWSFKRISVYSITELASGLNIFHCTLSSCVKATACKLIGLHYENKGFKKFPASTMGSLTISQDLLKLTGKKCYQDIYKGLLLSASLQCTVKASTTSSCIILKVAGKYEVGAAPDSRLECQQNITSTSPLPIVSSATSSFSSRSYARRPILSTTTSLKSTYSIASTMQVTSLTDKSRSKSAQATAALSNIVEVSMTSMGSSHVTMTSRSQIQSQITKISVSSAKSYREIRANTSYIAAGSESTTLFLATPGINVTPSNDVTMTSKYDVMMTSKYDVMMTSKYDVIVTSNYDVIMPSIYDVTPTSKYDVSMSNNHSFMADPQPAPNTVTAASSSDVYFVATFETRSMNSVTQLNSANIMSSVTPSSHIKKSSLQSTIVTVSATLDNENDFDFVLFSSLAGGTALFILLVLGLFLLLVIMKRKRLRIKRNHRKVIVRKFSDGLSTFRKRPLRSDPPCQEPPAPSIIQLGSLHRQKNFDMHMETSDRLNLAYSWNSKQEDDFDDDDYDVPCDPPGIERSFSSLYAKVDKTGHKFVVYPDEGYTSVDGDRSPKTEDSSVSFENVYDEPESMLGPGAEDDVTDGVAKETGVEANDQDFEKYLKNVAE